MTKLLLDQNLSPKTTLFLRNLGWNVSDIRALGKSGASDEEVYQLAVDEGWVLVTFDLDFSRRYMADKALPGLIVLRIHPQTLDQLHPALEDFLNQTEPDQLESSIITLENHRYRIRKV